MAPAGSRPTNNLFAGKDGTVYRRGNGGWERHDGTTWQPVRPGSGGEGVRSLDRENFKRKLGESRVQSGRAKPKPNAKGQNMAAKRVKPKPNRGGGKVGGGKKPKK